MINEYEFYESVDKRSSFFFAIFYLILIILDFGTVLYIFINTYLYFPSKLNKIQNSYFLKNDSVIYSGVFDTLLIFFICIFLFLFYKKIFSILFLSLPFIKIFYIKYLLSFYGSENYFKFINSYNFTKKITTFIYLICILFSLFGFSMYNTMDDSGLNKYIYYYKYNNISWDNINKFEYKLILWYDQRRSEQKLREKFIISGNFGEIDILDYNKREKVLKMIKIGKKYGNIKLISDDPYELKVNNFIKSMKKKEKEKIFEVYNEIKNYN